MQKRNVVIFIPYYVEGGEIYVFLQKRSQDAERLPGYFGFWGGGIDEGESLEEGLAREVKEELGLDVKDLKGEVSKLSSYEFLRSIKEVYIYETNREFEKSIILGEGDFGIWFSASDCFSRSDFILEDKVVINDMQRVLQNKPIL